MSTATEAPSRRIGIIAGSGPEAGIDLWAKVLDEQRKLLGDRYRGDIDAPEVTVVSVPELGYSMDLEREEERVWAALERAARQIAPQVDVYVIACNTLNYFAERLRALELPAELITPADTVSAELEVRGIARVALLGSRQTMDLAGWSCYRGLVGRVDIELPGDGARLHRLIERIKAVGGPDPELEREFTGMRQELTSETVLLACTELPLLRGSAAQEAEGAIDVSRLLARAAVRWRPAAPGAAQAGAAQAVAAPAGAAQAGAGRQAATRVAILYTGGTFGMAPTASGLAPHPHLRAEIERLAAAVGEAGGAPLTWSYAETERAIDSAEAGPESLARLSDRIRELVDRERPDGVLVIHGTDTMAYTAAYAAFALADLALPIVFTGSQVPLSAAESDAPRNFSQALSAAGGPLAAGVWIAFDGLILPAVRAVKRSSESFSAFAAPRGIAAGALGVAPQLAAALRGAAGRVGPRVGLVKVTPGLNAAQLAAALDACPAGVVLEGYGAGTAPVVTGGLAAPVRAAAERGTAILVTTQCTDGAVALGRYAVGSELAAAGATGAGDMTAEAALGKLAALVRAGYAGEELERLLTANLIGERLG